MHYQDFVIQLTVGDEDELVMRVSQSPAGESEDVAVGRGSPLLDLLEHDPHSPLHLEARLDEEGPEPLGRRLYEALFTGPIESRFLESLGRLGSGADGAGLRIKLQVDLGSPLLAEAHALPWELLYRAETGTFFALDRRFAVVRYLRLPVSRHLPQPPERLKLLVAVASPTDCQSLDTEEECRRIAESWENEGPISVHFLARATLDRLRNALLADEYHGLHFIGHGRFETTTGRGFLVLEDEHRAAAPCSARDLAIQLADRTSLRWVFVNACSTGASSATRPYGGLATALLRTGVPAVLAMHLPVSDRAALVLSRTVYRRLAAGDPVDTAVSEGRLAVHRHCPRGLEWATPVLFLRAADGDLFQPATPTPPPTPPLEAPTVEAPGRRYPLAWAVVILVLVAWIVGSYEPTPEPHPNASSPNASSPKAASSKTPSPETSSPETSSRPRVPAAVTVPEGRDVELPALGARISVSFNDAHGTPLVRVIVAFPGEPETYSDTLMGPKTLDLGRGRRVSVQSLDWSRREILVLPLTVD